MRDVVCISSKTVMETWELLTLLYALFNNYPFCLGSFEFLRR